MPSKQDCLSEVTFGAYLQYSPRGTTEVSKRSRMWRDAVKFDRPGQIRSAVEHLSRHAPKDLLGFFGADVTLVPAPRSAPTQKGALWVAERISEELLRAGLAGSVQPSLVRTRAVQKSAFASLGERPSPQVHLDSFAVRRTLVPESRILVVDDIITKGATLLAAVSVVQAFYPESRVLAFALLRTMGLVPEVNAVLSPCIGTVRRLPSGVLEREP